MAYSPKNLQIFTAAYSGCLAGMGLSDRIISNTDSTAYAGLTVVAGAFAQAIDTAWGNARVGTLLDTGALTAACAAYWQERSPNPDTTNTNPLNWTQAANAVLAPITASEAYFASQGITPPVIPGGNPSGGGNIVASLAALALVATGALQSGASYWVQTLETSFTLDTTSTLTPDNITIIAALNGGNWLRNINFSDTTWFTASAWYIDPTNGNDENNGQAQTATGTFIGPLKTHAELSRRWGNNNVLIPPFDLVFTTKRICRVFFLASITEKPTFNVNLFDTNTYLIYSGVLAKTTLLTSVVTGYTAAVPATNGAPILQDTTVSSWTPYLSARFRITSGVRAGIISWIAKDLGSNQARISSPGICGALSNPTSPLVFTETIPVAGDPYVIESFPTCTFGNVTVNGTSFMQFQIQEIAIKGGSFNGTPSVTNSLVLIISAGEFSGAACRPGFVSQCCVSNGFTENLYPDAPHYIQGGLYKGTVTAFGGQPQLMNAPMFQGAQLVGTNVRITSGQFYDATSGILVGISFGRPNNGYMAMGNSPVGNGQEANPLKLWGSGNSSNGIVVAGGSAFTSDVGFAGVTVTGTAGDFRLDTGAQSRAWDDTAAAGLGAYTALRNNTWTLVNTTIAGGGFGGNAHNVGLEAHLLTNVNS